MDVMEGQAFAVIEANPEAPFLPAYLLSLNVERGAFGLDHLIGLRSGPRTRS
jgi:hypothetical protein